MTRSLRTVLRDLPLQHVWIVYPGRRRYPIDEAVSVLPVVELPCVAPTPTG